jgi:hypothetical protein
MDHARQTGAIVKATDNSEVPPGHLRGIDSHYGDARDFQVRRTHMGVIVQGLKELRQGEQLQRHHTEAMHVMVYPGDEFSDQTTADVKAQWP